MLAFRAVQVRDEDAEDARAVAKRGLPVEVADAGMDQFQIRNRGGGASASRADNGAFLSKRGVRGVGETYLTNEVRIVLRTADPGRGQPAG
jgi:hypothetical protein